MILIIVYSGKVFANFQMLIRIIAVII